MVRLLKNIMAVVRSCGHRELRPSKNSAIGYSSLKKPLSIVPDGRFYGWPIFWMTGVLVLLSACANVKPWERESLSKPGMEIDAEPMMSACDDHIYFSREASKGGRSYSGGGCG